MTKKKMHTNTYTHAHTHTHTHTHTDKYEPTRSAQAFVPTYTPMQVLTHFYKLL